jgi:hypothetical protein
MACKICGNEKTIRCHLMPRALMHDLRGAHPNMVMGGMHRPGIEISQSGTWDDDLLCETHEQLLQKSDQYGVDWIRRFSAQREAFAQDDIFLVPNERPDLFLKFVCSVVWRHAMSGRSSDFNMDLGPWEVQLRDLIFAESNYNPVFVIAAKRWLMMSEYVGHVAFPPHRNFGFGKRGWEFEIGGLVWILILDSRKNSRQLKIVSANDCNPVRVINNPDSELVDRPGVIDIAVNMETRRKPVS